MEQQISRKVAEARMKKPIIALIAVILVMTLIAIISSLPSANIAITQDDMEHAYATNDGIIQGQITVNSGDSFKVTLYAHWSSGMRWSVRFNEPGIVRQDGPREFTNDGPPLTTGSPGHEEWTFKALAEGETTITMTYGSVANLPDAPRNVNTLILVVEVEKG